MKSSSIAWSPTCHGQSRLDAISPPTIRLFLGRPQNSGEGVVGGGDVAICKKEKDIGIERIRVNQRNCVIFYLFILIYLYLFIYLFAV